jgi:hypothetical protein
MFIMKNTDSIRIFRLFLFSILMSSVFEGRAEEIKINIVAPNPTNECWIVGNFNKWDIQSAMKCSRTDYSHFSVMLNDSNWVPQINLGNLEYKYVKCNCDWACVEKGKLGQEVPSRKFRMAITDTIAKWSSFSESNMISISVKTPPGTQKCYLIGDYTGWGEPNEIGEMVQVGKDEKDSVIFRNIYSLYATMCHSYKYQFCCGPTLDYLQAIPSYSFETDKTLFPSIIAWKNTFRTDVLLTANCPVKVHVNQHNLILDGLTGNENIIVAEMSGRIYSMLKPTGETKRIITLRKGCYILKVNSITIPILI